MQNKGFIKLIAVLMGLICCFYFSFSFVTSHYEKKAAAMGEQQGKAYLDSLRSERVWLGYDYKRCEELQIGLGLDLKGGMNVILEVSVPDVVKNLAGSNINEPSFKKPFDEAVAEAKNGTEDFVDIFIQKFQAANGQGQLGGIFANSLKEANITPNSSDDKVRAALVAEVKAAVGNSYQVVRERIDRFGVAQPNIQILEGRGQMGQIMVEMPGIKEPERVRKLLEGSANLEFWETYRVSDLQAAIRSLDSRMAGIAAPADTVAPAQEQAKAEEATPDSTKALFTQKDEPATDAKAEAPVADAKAQAKAIAEHPLLARLLQGQFIANDGCIVGLVNNNDTAAVMQILTGEQARQTLPADVHFAWSVAPSEYVKGNFYELYALKKVNGAPALAGDVIADAKDDFDQYHRPVVSMTMNTQGGRDWAAVTKKNLKRPVAIVLDGFVYSAPVIQNEITGGVSQISGHFTAEDTKDLANVLKSGKMPAPTTIVSEETVGPSLGAASIQAGFMSCVVAFVLLMLFMCLYYGFIPGMVANGALLINFFFTFGVLTSFQAALTMSGIAGLVLSLGMAVDANVLIYERTKEELRNGKNIRQALADGYGNAFSAILDSNVTSIITALILYNFGTGPIRGFAMTLGIGICASFFTAVWLTRIVYEHFHAKDKWLGLTFMTPLSQKFMVEKQYAFMSAAKKSYTTFGILVLIGLASLGIRGLQQGIDFTGGRNYVVEFEQKVTSEEVDAVVSSVIKAKDPDAAVSCLDIVTTSNPAVRISTSYRIDESGAEVDQEVEHLIWEALSKANLVKADYATFKDRDNHTGGSIISAQKVGATVAADMTKGAVISVILSLIAIFIYILLRFRNVAFSIGSIAALTVDTFLIVAMYSLCWGWCPFSLEVDQTFIAAVLTAIGYSINDKVVVFDRIREELGKYPNRSYFDVFNLSINATLTRTIMTSLTTLLVLLCIFFLGGDSIRSFAFAMILGVVFGTCSSIFLASPIALSVIGKRGNRPQANAEA